MKPGSHQFDVLLEDGPLLAVNKPAGLLTLGAIPGVRTLEREVKAWLKARFDKPGNVYLGIPHRLDRPVSGVDVFARNSKTAARLAEQFRERQVRKVYWALVDGIPSASEGGIVDWLLKTPDNARVAVVPPETPSAREARLKYRTLGQVTIPEGAPTSASPTPHSEFRNPHSLTWLEIELLTGRMHQIRVQLASRGWPVLGDVQYGTKTRFDDSANARDAPIARCSTRCARWPATGARCIIRRGSRSLHIVGAPYARLKYLTSNNTGSKMVVESPMYCLESTVRPETSALVTSSFAHHTHP